MVTNIQLMMCVRTVWHTNYFVLLYRLYISSSLFPAPAMYYTTFCFTISFYIHFVSIYIIYSIAHAHFNVPECCGSTWQLLLSTQFQHDMQLTVEIKTCKFGLICHHKFPWNKAFNIYQPNNVLYVNMCLCKLLSILTHIP